MTTTYANLDRARELLAAAEEAADLATSVFGGTHLNDAAAESLSLAARHLRTAMGHARVALSITEAQALERLAESAAERAA